MRKITPAFILKEFFYFSALLLILGATAFFIAVSPPMNSSHAEGLAPDNSKVNKRDMVSKTLTAEDQAKGSPQDSEMTRQIRERLTRDTALSTYGKNIKIITLKGVTTLRGPVANKDEMLFIERVARNVSARVENKLEVINR